MARDLLPLGYHCVMFDGDAKGGGMMRTQIPRFRLPESVTDEEVDLILDMGVETRFGQFVDSLKALLAEDWDAVFVGCGAPRGRELDIPGRKEAADHIHIGIDWLSSVSFGHIDKIGQPRHRARRRQHRDGLLPLVAPARRRGGHRRRAQRLRGDEGLSPWEKEDAMHEGIPILNFLVPVEFTHERRQADRRRCSRRSRPSTTSAAAATWCRPASRDTHIPCDDVLVAIGQENAFPWIERDIGIEFDRWDMPKVDPKTMQSTLPNVFFGGDAAFGPKNIIWAVAHGHDAAISIDKFCHGEDVSDRPPPGVTLVSQKMGIHEWSYDNDISNDLRYKVPLRDTAVALKDIRVEVELGYDEKLGYLEAERCLNCDVQTVFTGPLCIECDACVDICPMDCITFTENGDEDELRGRLMRAGAQSDAGSLYRQFAEDRAHHGQGRGCLPALRPVRRALPDRRLGHAQIPSRHDTGRARHAEADRQRRSNDFVVKFANVNGSGSASANALFAKSILRMGIPASSRNIFPSNIQGLPTWYEVRISESGHLGRRGGVDMMVAMNPQTWDEDIAEIEPGGYLFYDSTKPCRRRNSATTSTSSARR